MPQEIRIQGDNIRVIENTKQDPLMFQYRRLQGLIQRSRLIARHSASPQEFNKNARRFLSNMRLQRLWLKSLTEEQRARITAEISTGNR